MVKSPSAHINPQLTNHTMSLHDWNIPYEYSSVYVSKYPHTAPRTTYKKATMCELVATLHIILWLVLLLIKLKGQVSRVLRHLLILALWSNYD